MRQKLPETFLLLLAVNMQEEWIFIVNYLLPSLDSPRRATWGGHLTLPNDARPTYTVGESKGKWLTQSHLLSVMTRIKINVQRSTPIALFGNSG